MRTTVFLALLALATLSMNCGSYDPPVLLDGEYITTILAHVDTCPQGGNADPDTRLIVRVESAGEGAYDIRIAPDTVAEVYIPSVPVAPDGSFSVTYPWTISWLSNRTKLSFTGVVVWEELRATATLTVLPPEEGTYPACHITLELSGPRCSGGICTPPTY